MKGSSVKPLFYRVKRQGRHRAMGKIRRSVNAYVFDRTCEFILDYAGGQIDLVRIPVSDKFNERVINVTRK